MAKWVLLAGVIALVWGLGGCAAVRAPILYAKAREVPVPGRGVIERVEVEPVIHAAPLFKYGPYPSACAFLRVPDTPEHIAAFYREALVRRGWREVAWKSQGEDDLGAYERGDGTLRAAWYWEMLTVKTVGTEADGTLVKVTVITMYPTDVPGLFLQMVNGGNATWLYYATGKEWPGKVASFPGAVLIAVLF